MIQFLKDNLATIIIAAIVIGLMAWVVIHRIRQRQRGESTCGCGCSGCAEAGDCHK